MTNARPTVNDDLVQAQLDTEITATLYASLNKSLIVTFVVALSICYVLSGIVPKGAMLVWLGALATAYAIRHTIGLIRKKNPSKATELQWLHAFRLSTALCGAAWGLACTLLFTPGNIMYQAYLTACMVGVCGGAIVVYTVEKVTYFAFSLSLFAVALPNFFVSGNDISHHMAFLLIVYIIYTTAAGLSSATSVRNSIWMRVKSIYTQNNIDVLSQRQKLHIENTPLAVIEWSADFKVRAWNAAAENMFGYTAAEAIGKHGLFLVKRELDDELNHLVENLMNNVGYHHAENENVRKDGKLIYCAWFNTPIIENGVVTGFASLVQDKTVAKESQDQVQRLAYFDPLTKLPNRALLLNELTKVQMLSQRKKSHACAIFIDLDNFKSLNDSKGHTAGDIFLQEVAKRLQTLTADSGVVARLGGDEFVLLFSGLGKNPQTAARESRKLAEKVMHELSQPFLLYDTYHNGTASIGICLFMGGRLTNSDVLKRADTAMYEVKHAGRNQVKMFDESSLPALEMRANLKHDIQTALKNNELALHYQVQVNSVGVPIGAELLLRWHHPKYGLISPGDFIPLAEESLQIIPIGTWAIAQACAQLKKWESSPLTSKLVLSVNVSAIQFAQENFVETVEKIIKSSGCVPKLLTFELTESAILENIDEVIAKMNMLKKIGINLSMDDFGVGYSSFSALRRLPIDELKIDQSFIEVALDNATNATIVKSIVELGRNIGLTVVAEGVETYEQARFLRSCYCRTFQGYLYGRPCNVDDFEIALRALADEAEMQQGVIVTAPPRANRPKQARSL